MEQYPQLPDRGQMEALLRSPQVKALMKKLQEDGGTQLLQLIQAVQQSEYEQPDRRIQQEEPNASVSSQRMDRKRG